MIRSLVKVTLVFVLLLAVFCSTDTSESCSKYYSGKLILAVGDDFTIGITAGESNHPYSTILEKKLPQAHVELIGAVDNSRSIHDLLSDRYLGWPLFTTLPSVVIILAGGHDFGHLTPDMSLRMLESMHIMTHRFAQSKRVDIKTIAVTLPSPSGHFLNEGLRKFAARDSIKQHGRLYRIKEFTSLVDLGLDDTFSVYPSPMWTADPAVGPLGSGQSDAHLTAAGHDAIGERIFEELCRISELRR
jgi:hypothetical protein